MRRVRLDIAYLLAPKSQRSTTPALGFALCGFLLASVLSRVRQDGGIAGEETGSYLNRHDSLNVLPRRDLLGSNVGQDSEQPDERPQRPGVLSVLVRQPRHHC